MDADGNPFPLNDLMNDDVSANPWDNIWEWGASQRAYRFANAGYKVLGLAARKPVFEVSVKASFKPVSSATETS